MSDKFDNTNAHKQLPLRISNAEYAAIENTAARLGWSAAGIGRLVLRDNLEAALHKVEAAFNNSKDSK